MAISQGHHQLVLNFLEKVPSVERKGIEAYSNSFLSHIFTLVDILMNKDPGRISNALSFLTKILEIIEDGDFEDEKIKEMFGDMFGQGNNKKNIFYLIECPEFDGKSLLWYINFQNVRLFRQREELIDLSLKIANMKTKQNSEKAMDEVINNFKSGLASGVGLRDMINMIKERYPWSSSKKYIMILVSLVVCLLGIGLYVLDLTTDVQFSLAMLHLSANGSHPEYPTFSSVFKNKSHPGPQECWKDFQSCWEQHYVDPEENFIPSEPNDIKITGWFALWHCIQPFLGTFIVFLCMNYKRKNCGLEPEHPDGLQKLGYLLCLLISVVPIPALTSIYMFYLNVRNHHARTQPDFRSRMDSIEIQIQKYEALGTLERINYFRIY